MLEHNGAGGIVIPTDDGSVTPMVPLLVTPSYTVVFTVAVAEQPNGLVSVKLNLRAPWPVAVYFRLVAPLMVPVSLPLVVPVAVLPVGTSTVQAKVLVAADIAPRACMLPEPEVKGTLKAVNVTSELVHRLFRVELFELLVTARVGVGGFRLTVGVTVAVAVQPAALVTVNVKVAVADDIPGELGVNLIVAGVPEVREPLISPVMVPEAVPVCAHKCVMPVPVALAEKV